MQQRIQSGKLFHEITIQDRSESINDYGESTPVWSNLLTTYAKLLDKGGRELLAADQVDGYYDSVFEIRSRENENLRGKMRVVYKGRNYNIGYIDRTDERGRKTLLFCTREETTANG